MRGILAGAHGAPAAPDHVVAEGLTFLRRRPARRSVSEAFFRLFATGDPPGPIVVLPTTEDVFAAAVELHFARYDRALSIVDCVLISAARRRGAAVATFDRGFEGEVELLDA